MNKKITAKLTAERTIVHQYRFYYYLANELAYKAIKEKHEMDSFRYSVGVIIFSFSTIETFIYHILNSREHDIHKVFSTLSKKLRNELQGLSLPGKIEFILKFYPKSKTRKLEKDKEPFQSFDLLRQLRNCLIHYLPSEETVWSDDGQHLKEITKLERKAKGKFHFDELSSSRSTKNKAFVYRCFNGNCAVWAFKQVKPFIYWLCEGLNLKKPLLKDYWELSP